MCPVCLATAAIVAGSASSGGGLAALVVGKFLRKKSQNQIPITPPKEDRNGNEPDRGSSQDRIAR